MAEFGDLRGPLEKMIQLMKAVERHTRCLSCANEDGTPGDLPVQQSVSGTDGNVGDLSQLKSFSIVKTSSNADTVTVSTSDGNTFTLTEQGEVFTQAATAGFALPEITLGGAGTFKYHGIK